MSVEHPLQLPSQRREATGLNFDPRPAAHQIDQEQSAVAPALRDVGRRIPLRRQTQYASDRRT
jgi:hypothetical protein